MPARGIAIYGCLILALTGSAGLAVMRFEVEADQTSSPNDVVMTFEDRWPVFASLPEPAAPMAADVPASRVDSELEPEEPVHVSALAPEARAAEDDQSESKGYIFYFNSPTHWTPVPLPESIGEERAPHNRNIRAEIEQAAMLFDVDIRMMKAFARIESGYNPKVTTGKYKCLFQLSDWEFSRYWHGDIYDIRDCSIAAARKLATEAAQFERDVGRPATAAEIYCIHQQGYQGCSFHYAAPQQLAWKNMYLTAEGQQRGEAWARKAIWGNVPSDIKDQFKGGVEALTSAQFIAIWTERVERFMARKSEPPTDYDEAVSKTKALAQAARRAAAKTVSAVKSKRAAIVQAAKKKAKIKLASR